MRFSDTILYQRLRKYAALSSIVDTVKSTHSRANSVAEDAGTRLGATLGDMFGRLSTDYDKYEDRDIVRLRNQQEEIALLNRETSRLRRLARILKRRKDATQRSLERAINSPFI